MNNKLIEKITLQFCLSRYLGGGETPSPLKQAP